MSHAPSMQRPQTTEIEQAFMKVVLDLHAILVIDAIDEDNDGFRIFCHDTVGLLPVVRIPHGAREYVLESVRRETVKLYAASRTRGR